ncbi:MAG: hypothetical protein ACRBF0_13955 [Calditrichia bacterium]
MAIVISESLSATPNTTTLPKRITLRQKLISNQTSEKVQFHYTLNPDHDIWFKKADGTLLKAVQRSGVAAKTVKEFSHRITLVRNGGNSFSGTLIINQTIIDESNNKLADLVTIIVKR